MTKPFQHRRKFSRRLFSASVTVLIFSVAVWAQSTSFTYQGKLADGGTPATGSYDLQFKLFDTLTDGNQVGKTVVNSNTTVIDGVFTVELDFDAGVFDGAPRFLEICVRPTDSTAPYTVLAPRQAITSTPYAMRSANAAAADGLSAACAGCVTDSHIETVDGGKISGEIPIESVPTGSNNYIQNAAVASRAGRPAVAQEGEIDLTGDGKFGGKLIVIGNAGIGLSNPTNGQLHVLSSALGVPAIYGESATSRGVWGKSTSSRGVYGESNSGEGVYGVSNTGIGVYGESAALNSLTLSGVFGRATATGGTGVSALSTGSGGVGIYGEAITGRGVWGKSTSSRGVFGESNSGEGVYGISNTAAGVRGISNNASGAGGYFQNNAGGTALLVDGSGKVLFSGTGFVGIGTINPTTPLHIEGTGGIAATIKSTNERAILALDSNTPTGGRRVWTLESGFGGNSNNFVIFDQTANRKRLEIDSAGMVAVNVLQINNGLDLAEHFEVAGEAKPGMLVAIDPQNVGKFAIARGAYNRRVAGVISGANNLSAGMVLAGSSTKDSKPVALSGRAWVYCDAAQHPIKPGDLLTTSTIPGHAMKVRNYTKAQGAIIGKAMTALKGGRGLVLVLVSLQ